MEPANYLEHLTDADLETLVEVSHTHTVVGLQEFLHEDPNRLSSLLGSEALYDHLFGARQEEAFLKASPFLVFAVCLGRAHVDLQRAQFVDEWMGPARRVPVFEVGSLRAFSAEMSHRFFLAELLASYTRVASGSYWIHTKRGWQRKRYSELDLMRLVEMLAMVPEAHRPAILRRLGDLTLFLTGVFPDFSGTRIFRPSMQKKLQWAVLAEGRNNSDGHPTEVSPLTFLETIGSASYRQASAATQQTAGGETTLRDMAGNFGEARRVLNFVTDRYLFPFRDIWFPSNQN